MKTIFQQNYDKTFLSQVYSYAVVTYDELRRGNVVTKNEPVRIQYNTKDQYKRTAKLLGLMDDFKVISMNLDPYFRNENK